MKRTPVLFAVIFFVLMLAGQASAAVYIADISGVITGFTAKHTAEALARVQKDPGSVIVFRIDTPGGILDSTREIVQAMFESGVPVVSFVAPQGARAGSAGTFITLAADYAVMSAGSNIGAAHPVNALGQNIEGDMREKITNDTLAFMRSIAERQHRPLAPAEKTITESASYTAAEALNLGLVNAVVSGEGELLALVKERFQLPADIAVVRIEPTAFERVAFFLGNPNVLILLLFIGIACVYLEIKMPGTFIFAGVGATAIALFLVGINIIPVNWLGLLLLAAGVAFLIAEVFITSFGLLSIAGAASLGAGMYLLFDRAETMGVQVSLSMIVGTILAVAVIILAVGRLVLNDMRRKPASGLEALVGETGRIMEWKDGQGKLFVHGEIWKAESGHAFEKNDQARVVRADRLTLQIEPVQE